MRDKHMDQINGTKIRWQFFTWPIFILLFCMIFVPFTILIFDLYEGKFIFSEWLSGLSISVWVCLVLAIPFIILYILNLRFFGKIICVLNSDGIHYENGLLKWEDITNIEYEIVFPGRRLWKSRENRYCHAVIYTEKETIKLIHTPIYFIFKVKKYKPSIDAKLSKGSKWTIRLIILASIIIPFIVPFFE